MNWIKTKDRLPKIPKGKYGVTVLGAVFDPIYEELDPGHGYHIDILTFDGIHFLTLGIPLMGLDGNRKCEFLPSPDCVTHWMPLPDPPKEATNGENH